MANILAKIIERAGGAHPTIVLPEGTDARVVTAAARADQLGLARMQIIGKPLAVRQLADDGRNDIGNVDIIVPSKSEHLDAVTEYVAGKSFAGDMDKAAITSYATDPIHFGAALVGLGFADGMVAGAVTASSEVVRTAIRLVGVSAHSSLISSIFLMVSNDGESAFTFTDCGVVPDPDAAQLAAIASDAADFHQLLTDHTPQVAFLSFSTHGSASHPMVEKPREAAKLFAAARPDIIADGELQLDAAILPSVARSKAPDSPLNGQANVLVFPDLNAGNIGYKLTERLGGFTALGPLLQGLDKPVHDLSRGCSAEDIVQIVAIAALQAAKSA